MPIEDDHIALTREIAIWCAAQWKNICKYSAAMNQLSLPGSTQPTLPS